MTPPRLRDVLAPFRWSTEPATCTLTDTLTFTTRPDTDYWQRTHYGFRRDNGHFFFVPVDRNFSLTAHVAFTPNAQYDQCGVMCRVGPESWIKASVEYELHGSSRLGSVVTNLGYSDWATQDVDASLNHRWYRISRRGEDFKLESSTDGDTWEQMRIAHLHGCPDRIDVGVYGCSPVGAGFECRVLEVVLGPNAWDAGA